MIVRQRLQCFEQYCAERSCATQADLGGCADNGHEIAQIPLSEPITINIPIA
ncbi:hypothetical protein KPSA3_06472 [Pseudomonas syringae pv. actinidiae]|uniref:Uncharacterized protein n=1 Tax=Pseudomonas syringae pv. actinidiae TaxID=103796 RepID=A0AAN4QAQ9_PSESF|nr:hypothetical protein KPSA3_06472 [Pseudomonas syringae pv. actinidiae]